MALRPSRFESLPLNRRQRRTSDSFANRLGLRVRSLLPAVNPCGFERTFLSLPLDESKLADSISLRRTRLRAAKRMAARLAET